MSDKEKAGAQILAASIDNREETKKFIQRLNERSAGRIDFPMLEDKNHKVIDRYGLLNPDGRGWPHPATYVIDKQGIVRWLFVDVDYTKRAANEQILRELRKLM